MEPNTILEDKREIEMLAYDTRDGECYQVGGAGGVTAIIAYGEPSQYCNVPFFAVYKGDELRYWFSLN
jgi:hypothetical protein